MCKKSILLTALVLVLTLAGTVNATHIVFNGAYQNNWSGITTTTFQSATVMDLTGGSAWFWKNCSNSSAQDLALRDILRQLRKRRQDRVACLRAGRPGVELDLQVRWQRYDRQ